MQELRSAGIAGFGRCSLWQSHSIGVSVCGSRILWELQSVGLVLHPYTVPGQHGCIFLIHLHFLHFCGAFLQKIDNFKNLLRLHSLPQLNFQ